MQFGLWFEPEMVNPDSDVFRAHPDWILAVGGREPACAATSSSWTSAGPRCATGCSGRSTPCSRAYPIAYVKWDHNRDLVRGGAPGPARRAGRAPPDSRFLRRCSTGCGRRTRAWSGRAARAAAARIDLERARAGAAGVDLRHDRRARPAGHPALDRAAGGARVPRRAHQRAGEPPDRARDQPRLPRRHRVLRRPRHRVGPRGRERSGSRPTRRVDRALQASTGPAALRRSDAHRFRRGHRVAARCRGRGSIAGRCSRTSSSTRWSTTRRRCGSRTWTRSAATPREASGRPVRSRTTTLWKVRPRRRGAAKA